MLPYLLSLLAAPKRKPIVLQIATGWTIHACGCGCRRQRLVGPKGQVIPLTQNDVRLPPPPWPPCICPN